MNKNKVIYYLAWCLMLFCMGGCQSYVEGFETDPNNPSDSPPDEMIQGVMLADMFVHAGDLNRLAGMWMGYFTGVDRQYATLNTWAGSSAADFDNTWGNFYSGVIAQARIVEEKAAVENKIKLRGVAKVLEAHAMGTMTALWGDIPNTEACNDEEFPNPQYDDQASVYASLQELLTSAIVDLAGAGSIVNDVFLNNDAAAWVAFAHSLKARYFLHTGAYAQAESEALEGILTMEGEVWAPFGSTYGADFSPYYAFLVYDRAGYMNAAGAYAAQLLDPTDFMGNGLYRGNAKTNEEARFNWLYIPADENFPYDPNYISDFDWGYYSGKFGKIFPLFTAGETMLIMAESILRNGDAAAALNTYNEYRNYLRNGGGGFVEYTNDYTLQYDDYEMADFETGGMVNHDQATAAEALLYEIMEERYIALAGELEAFNDWTRTNNLIDIPVKTGSAIPERFLYPQVEVNANASVPTPLPDFFTPTPLHQ